MAKYQPRAICWKNLQCKFLAVQTESVDSSIWQAIGCQRVTQETCDLWDIWSEWWYLNLCELVDISDSWELGFMTFIVSWQLRVTLDSICNSCDVWFGNAFFPFPLFFTFPKTSSVFLFVFINPTDYTGIVAEYICTSIQIYQHVPLFIHCDQHPWKYVGDMSMPIPAWLPSRPSGRRSWCWSG